jgi:hypothetical protein
LCAFLPLPPQSNAVSFTEQHTISHFSQIYSSLYCLSL